ncbi:SRPBCC domain-containing protein [Blastococcus sp. SYSU D00820]
MGESVGRGTVTTGDGGRQLLEFVRTWPLPAAEVWAALTEPDRLARWIGVYDGERAEGGRGSFTMTAEGQHEGSPTRIVECRAPARLVVAWEQDDGGGWQVALDLAEQDGGTALRFSQELDAGADATDLLGGWHWYLDRLDAELTGATGPGDWDTFWAATGPTYGRV